MFQQEHQYFSIDSTKQFGSCSRTWLTSLSKTNLGEPLFCSLLKLHTQPGQQLRIANEQCQCNADWLQNQTSFWLNKWLSSSNAANQMRALVSSSTGATQLTNYIGSGAKRDASQHRTGPALALTETQHSPANNSNHHQWSAWHRATRAYNNANNSQMNGSHHNRPFRRHSQQSNKIMLQGERGPQGPKVSLVFFSTERRRRRVSGLNCALKQLPID